jgi:CubicO group peptidase (beta-lactamase class C family)
MNQAYESAVRFLIATSLSALLACAPCAAQGENDGSVNRERAANLVALYTKLLCSGVFVIGRDADEFIRNDLQQAGPGIPGWDQISVSIDRTRKSVTLTMAGVPPRTAVFNGDQGCTLLPVGEDKVLFEPVKLPSALPDSTTQPWPMGDVTGDTPLPPEVDKDALSTALDFAFDNESHDIPQNTRAIVVVYKGRIIAERYAPGFDKDTRHICWSMGKSITSALIGTLVRDGHFRVDDPAPIPEWRDPNDPRSAITISHLLRMSSGLKFHSGTPMDGQMLTNKDNHTYVYFGAIDVFDYSINRELEFPPNTKWRYRNCDPLALGKIIRDTVEARGEEYLSFPHRALFSRIGMSNMVLEVDPYGNFIMTGFDYGTARDWARFGLLHLLDGLWQGERILPEGWVDYITTPAPANASKAYGALFWLNRGKQYESLPEDMYWPAGHYGQVVMIIPSRDMIIVRLGHSVGGGFDPYIGKVVRTILASVNSPPRR